MGKLLGRRTEIELMLEKLSRPIPDGKGRAVQTAAPPGSGKSALLEQVGNIFLCDKNRREYANFFCATATTATAAAESIADKIMPAQKQFLSSLFPIAIIFNYGTSEYLERTSSGQKKAKLESELESSIALRIAFTLFKVHTISPLSQVNISHCFRPFRKAWQETTAKPPMLLEFVMSQVQSFIGKKNILLIVDEPLRADPVPIRVRDLLFMNWFETHTNDRLVMSSLAPGHLGSTASEDDVLWVQLSKCPASVIETICSYMWVDELGKAKAAKKQQALIRYVFNATGYNWRAKSVAHGIFDRKPVPPHETIVALKDAQSGITKLLDSTSSFFLNKLPPEWVQAVNEFIVLTVLRIPVKLTCRSSIETCSVVNAGEEEKENIAGEAPASWLLKGLLSNPVPIVNSEIKQFEDIPEIPMMLVHEWLKNPVESLTEESQRIRPFVEQLWLNAEVFFHCVNTPEWSRYEGVMARWFALVLHCSHVRERRLRVCTESARADCTVLFPGFTMYGPKKAKDSSLSYPRTYRHCSQRVIELPYKISGPAASKITDSSSCDGHASVFVCKKGETAVDLILFVGKRLILIQLKLYCDPVPQDDLKTMLTNLTKHFRHKLWCTSKSTKFPFVAENLGLPCIYEKDVMFVLLATAGLAQPRTGATVALHANSCSGMYFKNVIYTCVRATYTHAIVLRRHRLQWYCGAAWQQRPVGRTRKYSQLVNPYVVGSSIRTYV